jgi:hypothetical protein
MGDRVHRYRRVTGECDAPSPPLRLVLVRDSFIFTNRRLILVDKQGMTGKKVDYTSVPYRHIHRFSVETAGQFDMDAELKIWVTGHGEPIKKEFRKGVDIYEVQAILAQYIAS